MSLHNLLEILASPQVLTAMITPVVLISACGTLIFSTSGRLGRLYDRLNTLKGELEGIMAGKLDLPEERITYAQEQLRLQRRRGVLIQRALASLYSATLMFIAASLAVALSVALGRLAWLATVFALSGGAFLFVASALLLFESRYNLTFINHHIDFIASLQEHAAGSVALKFQQDDPANGPKQAAP
ncbi:DUF2721 domain-containing protein [Geobacter pelophilus]|uniref:DUF2721 domain-containing protein n=1 Tax=Geoanaerobacter pelophilus TaxID=60036 RepID=A0AAW4L509_9BACT|nr:DUF2721 domain-containing protein [Geoanaerobacter pelophilus]MBT0662902.1 DUF2721 domain-containing protein [Geoanaerobacter pelophilus]